MSLRSFIKIMFRSRSCNVAKILGTESRNTVNLNLKHKEISLQIRTGTADTTLVKEMLIKNDKKCPYYVPISINPGVILDIGANIGIRSCPKIT